MANIKNYIENIRSAIFGKEVRGSLADGLDAINKETENTTLRQKHLENTFDQLIINEGNSNAEIVDARVGENGTSFEKLGDRLDNFDSHLAESMIESVRLDIGDLKANSDIMIDYIRNKQVELRSLAFQKLTTTTDIFTIITQGDSTIYGSGMEKDGTQRPADTTPTPSGAVHVAKRATISYPEKMQECLRLVYGNRINVINWGYSGDSAKMGYEKWNKKGTQVADVAIINYGINNGAIPSVPDYRDVSMYLEYMEKIIINHTLYNRAVYVLTPFKQVKSDQLHIKYFIDSLINLANKYNLPIIKGDILTENQDINIMSGTSNEDDKHFNSIGYSIIGARIAGYFIGTQNKVTSNDILLTRQTIDSIRYIKNCTFGGGEGLRTPTEIGTSIYTYINTDGSVVYSFETKEDNLCVYPIVALPSGTNFEMILDFEVQKSQNSYVSNEINNYPILNKNTINNALFNDLKTVLDGKTKCIVIPTKGIHTITINSKVSFSKLMGIGFLSLADLLKKEPFYYGYTSETFSSASVPTTRVPMFAIRKLGYSIDNTYKYKETLLKLSLNNYNKNTINYVLSLGYKKIGQENIITFGDDLAGDRTLTGIDIDTVTDELILIWGGVLTKPASFTIKVN